MASDYTGEIRAGDAVTCVDSEGTPFYDGGRYTVVRRNAANLLVIAEDPKEKHAWAPSRFVLAVPARPSTAKTSSPNPKDLIGIAKVPVGLFPSAGTILGAMSMKDGAVKYGPYNWREHPVKMTVYLDAMERHLLALRDGEDEASDSGVHHLGHILGCAAILADALAVGNLIDDRPHKGAAAALFEKFREKKKEAA